MDGGNILDGRQQDNIHDNHIHGHTEDNNDDNMEASIHHSFLSLFITLYGMYPDWEGAYLQEKWALR